MNKELLNKIITVVTASSLITFGVGSFILNNFLGTYKILDFTILKPRAITVGLAFFYFAALHILVLFVSLDLNDFSSNSFPRVVKVTLMKLFFVIDALLLFFNSWLIDEVGGVICALGLFLYFMSIALNYDVIRSEKKDVRFRIAKILNFLGFLFSLWAFIVLREVKAYFEVSLFEIAIFGSFLMVSWSNIYGIKKRHYEGGIFSLSKEDDKKYFKAFQYTFQLSVFIAILFAYSFLVFPFMSQTIGGGRPERITYFTSKDTIIGNKIHENEKYIFVERPDSTIVKLNWDQVERIDRFK